VIPLALVEYRFEWVLAAASPQRDLLRVPERHIKVNEFAALCFRILGVVILLRGLAQALFMVPSVAEGDWSAWGFARLLGLLVSLVFLGAVALPLIFHSEKLVGWLFPKSEKTIALAVSGRDLLMIGLALIGAWMLAGHLPYLARLAGELIWNLEGGRRGQLGQEFFVRAVFDSLGGIFTCVVGWLMFRFAGGMTEWWESRTQGEPGSAPREAS
jgi:hypothetical protein